MCLPISARCRPSALLTRTRGRALRLGVSLSPHPKKAANTCSAAGRSFPRIARRGRGGGRGHLPDEGSGAERARHVEPSCPPSPRALDQRQIKSRNIWILKKNTRVSEDGAGQDRAGPGPLSGASGVQVLELRPPLGPRPEPLRSSCVPRDELDNHIQGNKLALCHTHIHTYAHTLAHAHSLTYSRAVGRPAPTSLARLFSYFPPLSRA